MKYMEFYNAISGEYKKAGGVRLVDLVLEFSDGKLKRF